MKTLKQFLTEDKTTPITEAFTKQHYIAIAKAIMLERAHFEDAWMGDDDSPEKQVCLDVIDNIALNLADLFKKDNPQFDKGRFLSACGV